MNVIDALVVTLGLDARQYRKEAAATGTDQKKLTEQSDKMAKRLESDGKRLSQSFRSVRNEVAGLLLAFTGTASISAFAKSILTNDAAVGRLASNLGVATAELSKWEAVVQRVGGQPGDADSTFRTLKGIFNDVRLTGNMSAYGDLAGLGISDINQLKDPADALLTIAGTGERMDRSEFAARLGRLGISDSMITLLSKGRKGVSDYLAEQEKLGHATDESSKAAQRFEDRLAKLRSVLIEGTRPTLTKVVDLLIAMADAATAAKTPFDALSGSLKALAGGLGFFSALSRILAHITRARELMQSGHPGLAWQEWKAAANEPLFPNATQDDWISRSQRSVENYTSRAMGGGGRGPNAGIIAYLQRAGFSREQARGIDAGIGAEGGTPTARNPTSGAFGIGQWLGSRQRRLFARYGSNPSQEQQLAYLVWELNGGDHGGASVRGQSSAEGTLNAYIRNFMRPAAGRETMGDLSRGMAILGGRAPVGTMARAGGGSSTNTTSVGQITIYTAATDAQGIARDLPRALADRGLTVQSATGVAP